VLTASSDVGAADFDATGDVVVERVSSSRLFFPTWGARRAIESAIERHQPDLVLLDPAWPLGLLGPRLSRPYGVVLHGAEVTIPSRVPFVASSLRHVLRHATIAICAGSYPEGQARRNAVEGLCPVLRVDPGVDPARFHPLNPDERRSVRHELGVGPEEFLIVSYSRLVPRKGMDTLIRASASLIHHHPNLRVLIGGAGRDRARLERLAARCHAPVTFLGRVGDEEQPRWIAAADLMVLDCRSRWWGLEQEGFGIVFLEAAACGLAQVAGRSGGSDDAVRHGVTGLVVGDPRSVKDLATAIESMLLDPERRANYARAARTMAEGEFSWDRLARVLSFGLAPFDHFSNVETLA
jgi:phosphatidylinositol alpha-1,6-mannosyltransferase